VRLRPPFVDEDDKSGIEEGPESMGQPWPTDAALRAYVNRELDRAKAEYPDLTVRFQGEPFQIVPISQPLWWTIESPHMDKSQHLLGRHYLLEARFEESQFVIWFGGLSGFRGPHPRDVMFPAVHVPFPEEQREWLRNSLFSWAKELVRRGVAEASPTSASAATPDGQMLDALSLGAVLRWMLDHECEAAYAYDPMVYPMTGGRY
jgi:hypothetical protein